MTTLSRYILARTLGGIGLALGAVLAAILLIDVVEQMRSVGARVELSLFDAVGLTALKTPALIEQTLPFVVLAGVMIAMVQLNRRSELIAMRAAGVSAWRFLGPVIAAALAIGLVVVTLVNPLGSNLYAQFETRKEKMLGQRLGPSPDQGVWLRQGDDQGQVVIQAESVDAQAGVLRNATFFFFEFRGDALRFARRIRADEAVLRPGFWQLSGVVEGLPAAAPERMDTLALATTLDASDLLERLVSPATLSFWSLPQFIGEARDSGLSPVRFEIKWQTLLAYPILLAAMAALGGVFSLRLHRLGNVAQWGAIGVGLGLGLFFFGQFSQALAITQAVPPAVAAFSAPLAGLFTALAILCFLEDG